MIRLGKVRLLMALALAFVFQPVLAQEETGTIARTWAMTPKAGEAAAFNDALKAHAAWRRDNNDPWQWTFWRAASGNMDGTVIIRSTNHTYADFDAYNQGEFRDKALADWNANVAPHVGKAWSGLSRLDSDMVDWPEGDYKVVRVTRFHLKPGHGSAFRAAVQKVRGKMKEAGRQSTSAWAWSMTGDHLPTIMLITARNNWAGLDNPETSARETLTEMVGELEANTMMDNAMKHVERISGDMYVRADEFSGK